MMARRHVAAVAAGLMALSTVAFSQSVTEYNQKLGSVQQRIQAVRSKLAEARRRERMARSQFFQTQRQLNDTRLSLAETRRQLHRSRGQLHSISGELARMEARLYEKRRALTQRLEDAYKCPPSTYLVAFVTTQDTWGALTRTKMIQQIVESDLRLLEEIRESRNEIRRRQEAQRRKVMEINGLQARLASQEQQERELAWMQRAQYDAIRRDRVAYERHLDELIRQSQRIAAMIRRMQETPEGRRRLATAFTGGFIRPVSGRITSGFGMRYHPILRKTKLHTGVDIAAPSGTPIRAAAAGTVIIAGWMDAYGYTVAIDHGGGVSTLYAHCSSVSVRVGQEVSQGQVIGRVGSTGWSTGPHLHWEVRRNGQPVDPL